MDAASPDGLRNRSSSSNSHSSSAGRRRQPHTLRVKPKTRSSNTSSIKLSDDNSLTSFPSLSPSVANSPENTKRQARAGEEANANDGRLQSGRPSSTALDDLFAPASPGRLALFDEAPAVRDLPGALHHMSDAHIEHMIARLGATPLVKQMAQDLAQRDAQVTLLQRRAEERERLLKKMLRECEVSNLDIETRLKELEADRAKDARKTSGKSLASESSVQSEIEDAFEDILGTGGHDASNGGNEGIRPDRSMTTAREAVTNHPLDATEEGTVKKSTLSTGWRSIFGGGAHTAPKGSVSRAPVARTLSAQQHLSAIHSASQSNHKRKGLSSDLFRPPPAVDDESSVATASDNDEASRLERVDSESAISTTSVASWALKLVGGGAPNQVEPHAKEGRDKVPSSKHSKLSAGVQQHPGKSGNTQHARAASNRGASISVGPNGTLKRANPDSRTAMGLMMASSPNQGTAASTDEQGPTEMETILPDETRPPTLLPQDNCIDNKGVLTDRFGFIYDQNRRLRQSTRAKKAGRIETVENHRRSFNNIVKDDDANSISSQLSGDKRPTSPPSGANVTEQQPKRWQDYLKLSSLSGGELLSHTPSAAPITDIVTGSGALEGATPRKSAPKVSISHKGVDLTAKPEATPSRVVSENAEQTKSAEQELPAIIPADEQDSVKSLLDQLTEVHDALQREKTTRWDDFLKKIRTERARNGEIGTAIDRRSKHGGVPEASWTDGEVIGIAGMGNEGKIGRAKWTDFKNLVLGGIPVSYRAKVWAECSGASGMRMPGYYDELVSESGAVDLDVVNQIKMDIGRTLTDNIFFRKGTGVLKLEEILLAYARRNPDVGYCQGMNQITANLLLIMPTAEDAFWVLVRLIEHILPEKYYDQSLLASRADQTVLRQYVGSVLPQLSAHLDNLSIELEALTFQWFLSVFTDCLSAEALFRVWDVVLCTQDGATFLFQVALALLKLNERSLLACDSPSQIYSYINGHMTDHAVSIDGLIKASEGLRKLVKREEVIKRRAVVAAQELDNMREREALRKGKARAADSAPALDAESVSAAEERATAKEVQGEPTSRRASVIPVVDLGDEEGEQFQGELEVRSPMPIDEEAQWRG